MTMTPIRQNDAENTLCAAHHARKVRLTFALVLTTSIVCSIYASIDARGLYHDGVWYLFKIAECDCFFLHDPARTTVQILRQAPIVFLSRFTSMSLFERGQVFTFILLILPTVLCALCWFIAPRNQRGWILFPLAYLLVGFAATSMNAIGEAAIATSYFWILLFLFIFHTRSTASQALFLLLCLPAYQLQEGAFPLTGVLLFACAMRARVAKNLQEQLFIGFSVLLLAAILAYQMSWMIYPESSGDLESVLQGLTQLQFLYANHRLNLPLVTGTIGLLALTAVFFIHRAQPSNNAVLRVRTITIAFALFALAAAAAAVLIDESFAPFSQSQARYHPVFVSAALGTVVVLLLELSVPHRFWMQPATVFILIALCAAQTAADIVATHRWHAFVVDLRSRLANARGLVPWEATLSTGDMSVDINWDLMAIAWVIPVTSIVYAPNGIINSMIDLPIGATLRPVDPEKPEYLPILRGINYGPYQQAVADQKRSTYSQ
jgi:hypothetical protein